ncbi:NAC domain-containing protein 83-like [Humulus lupulus]|uniref:NAC domain-containing protein 83-like n=1 Tax=Humulus lupulus TaxID=3486 RepID=UPI002B40518F|nr:NAC domain-containing protein 83-like [Humulus lupulus]
MEKQNFGTNGGYKLPIGYRFCPTDEELLLHYLKRKVHAMPLPASVISDFDVFQTDPWALPGDVKEKRYFFCNHRKMDILNNKMCKRVNSGSGFWKPVVNKDKLIVASEFNNQAIGVRKTLVFCGGKRLFQDSKTRWFMHEYHFVRSQTITNSLHLISQPQMNWVVCGVFQKKRKLNNSKQRKRNELMMTEGSPRPSFSCSSGVTEVSSSINGGLLEDDQEESSANIISYNNGSKSSSSSCTSTRKPN